jgi:Beta-lactamase enzyme family
MKEKKPSIPFIKDFLDSFKSLSFYQVAASATFLVVASFVVFSLLDKFVPKEAKKNVDVELPPSAVLVSPSTSLAASSKVSPSSTAILPTPTINSSGTPNGNIGKFAYRLAGNVPNFANSTRLDKIVSSVVAYSTSKSLPTSALSVTLIDMNTGEKAEYQGTTQRYPASVVKMFWLVTAYQRISQGELKEGSLQGAIEQMIFKSDNQGASQVVDAVTATKSTPEKLGDKDLVIGKQKRQELNSFFNGAGYSPDINVSQKTFPIPQENIMEPKGFDQQLRGEDLSKPYRNRITTNDAARLMYEIVQGLSVSPDASSKMRGLLTRNIDPGYWKKQPPNPVDFNPVESFFGEGLPEGKTESIVSKAGWTSVSRQEVALVRSKDNKTSYILAVFGDDAAYGKSKKIFPDISGLVYGKMRATSKK